MLFILFSKTVIIVAGSIMAMRRFVIYLLLNCILASAASAQMPDWWPKVQTVKMLIDTREDVRKLFGKPDDTHRDPDRFATYYFGDYTVTFLLTPETCRISAGLGHGWNLPARRVEKISVWPNKKPRPEDNYIGRPSKVKFADLKLDMTGMVETPFSEWDPGSVMYRNDDKGVVFEVHSNGLLHLIEIYPTIAQEQGLRCAPNQEWDK